MEQEHSQYGGRHRRQKSRGRRGRRGKKLEIGKRKTKKTTSKLKEITIKDKKNLCNFLSEFAEKLGIEIVLAGLGASSFADGRATKKSDYDLCVVYYGRIDKLEAREVGLQYVREEQRFQISDIIHRVNGKKYEIDIPYFADKSVFEKNVNEFEELSTLLIEGIDYNPEQLLIYKKENYEICSRNEHDLTKLRCNWKKKIAKAWSKARLKYGKPKSRKDYYKGFKIFYVIWKLVLYAIQLAKYKKIVDFKESLEFWKIIKKIPYDIIYSKKGYEVLFEKLLEMGYNKKIEEFEKLAPYKKTKSRKTKSRKKKLRNKSFINVPLENILGIYQCDTFVDNKSTYIGTHISIHIETDENEDISIHIETDEKKIYSTEIQNCWIELPQWYHEEVQHSRRREIWLEMKNDTSNIKIILRCESMEFRESIYEYLIHSFDINVNSGDQDDY
tara:strand:- start:7869 stop:9200 length:1332 start_codon:yes stop_codon:yes gene_type:complete